MKIRLSSSSSSTASSRRSSIASSSSSWKRWSTMVMMACTLMMTQHHRGGGAWVMLPAVDASAAAASASVLSQAWEACQSLDIRYFIAGGTCAAISHGITTPIDVVKTKLQAQPHRFQIATSSSTNKNKNNAIQTTTKSMSIPQAAMEIVRTDGPSVLLSGLGPTLVGYGIEGAMKFGIYEVMKPVFAALLASGDNTNKGVAFLLASVVAGAVAALFLCPMESTRIRMVTDPAYAKLSFLPAWTKLVAKEGLGASFGGIWAMIAKQVPYTFGKQVSFDVVAKQLYLLLEQDKSALSFLKTVLTGEGNLKWFVSITAAFLASIVACLFSQPGDMIVTETYKESGDGAHAESLSSSSHTKKAKSQKVVDAPSATATTKSFPGVVSSIYQQGGIPEFFRGTGARIVHVGLIITSQLVIYDLVKQMLGLPATGSH